MPRKSRLLASACCLALVFAGLLLSPPPLLPQAGATGSIAGTVMDPSGAVVPGVAVTVTNKASGEKREVTTDQQGNFVVPLLKPGLYTVEFAAQGFRKVIRENVTVNVAEKTVVDSTLQVGSVTEVIKVTGEAPLLQESNATMGRVVGERSVESLPLANRNFTQLLALSPGTVAPVADTTALGQGSQDINVSGARAGDNSFTIDGVKADNYATNSTNDFTFAANGVAIIAPDAIQEFKVQTALYDASFGRSGGANINIVTKSGANEFHGTVYEFHRNDALNANNFFLNRAGRPRPKLLQNQFGFTLGGRIVRERTFFFVSYQGTRQVNGASVTATTSLRLPPIPAVRTPQALGAVFGGQTGAFGGLAIAQDGSNINPVALALLNFTFPNGEFAIPSPQRTGPGINYTISRPGRFREDQYNVNVDHQVARNNRLSVRYFEAIGFQLAPFTRASLPGWDLGLDLGNKNLAITDLHVLSPSLSNEVKLGYTRFSGATLRTEPILNQDIGLHHTLDDIFPEIPNISVIGAFSIGQGISSDAHDVLNVYTVGDTVSLKAGTHDLRFGFEFRRIQRNSFTPAGPRGLLIFQSFPDFLLGRHAGPVASGGNGTSFSNVFNSVGGPGIFDRYYRFFDLDTFVQDDWKIRRNLTLSLGLRVEFGGAESELHGNQSNFDFRLYQQPPPGGFTTSGVVIPSNSIHNSRIDPSIVRGSPSLLDYDVLTKLGPRIGFAYRPGNQSKFVIRGGYGIFYNRPPIGIAQQLAANNPPTVILLNLAGAANGFATFENPFPPFPRLEELPVPTVRFFFPPYSFPDRPIQGFAAVDPTSRHSYLQHYNLALQYEFATNFLVEVGYVGSTGNRLLLTRQRNQALLASPSAPVNGTTDNSPGNAIFRVPVLGMAPSGWINQESTGNSHLDSLQVSVTKRLGRGLQFLASYTLMKSFDNAEDNIGPLGIPPISSRMSGNQLDTRQARGLSAFDRTHRMVVSYVWEVPDISGALHLKNSRFGRKLLGGWQLAGITIMQSGAPFSIIDTTGASLFGVLAGLSRANFAPGMTLEDAVRSGSVQSRLGQYFNTAAFARATFFPAGSLIDGAFPVSGGGSVFGTAGRTILRGPRQTNFDFGLTKRTSITETKNIEFRWELFNAFNTPIFDLPGSNVASPGTFGVISAVVVNPRIMQFALKFNF